MLRTLATIVALCLFADSMSAAMITRRNAPDGKIQIIVSGEILHGDGQTFKTMVDAIPLYTDFVPLVVLDSPGGKFAGGLAPLVTSAVLGT